MRTPSIISSPQDATGFERVSDFMPPEGETSALFRKELMRVGTYSHPQDGWKLGVTESELKRWASASNEMIKNGVKIPVPDGHEVSSTNNRGFVQQFEVHEGKLFANLKLIGEDAIKAASRTDVSVFIEPDFIDGMGRKYGEAITHVALTPIPVIPGMSGFVKIAASRGLTQARPFSYTSAQITKSTEGPTMDIAALGKIIGVENLSEDNALKAVEDFAKKQNDQIAAIAAERDTFKTKAESQPDLKIDADTLDDRAETAEEQIDALVGKSIVPAVAASLKSIFCGKPGARPAYLLSRRMSGGDKAIFKQVIEALKQNDPKALSLLAEKTAPQGVALSRRVPDDNADPEAVKRGQAIAASMHTAAGLTAPKA